MPDPIPRRAAIGLLGGVAAARPASAAGGGAREWAHFKNRFITPDGQVIDTGNGGQSHSEGQGWGLMMAVHFGDRAAFRAILTWTRGHLRRESDRLHAWRWMPGRAVAVADRNNATDGDIFIAAALLDAGRLWSEPGLAEEGTAIARDVLRLLVRRVGARMVLLPGLQGFERPDHVVVNPSYYCFPALATLAEAVPDPAWLRLVADGLRLLREGRFGRWGLPPDWLAIARQDGRLAPAQGWPARFSYDAVRVPLWLAWAGLAEEEAASAALNFLSDPLLADVPAWADLRDDTLSPYPAGGGIRDIGRLLASERGIPWRGASPPPVGGRDYYDTVLSMLARAAQVERRRAP